MADKKDYYIYVAGEKVLVSKEIYDAITQMDRQERTQSDKDKRNELLRYEELTTASVTGEELLYDSTRHWLYEMFEDDVEKYFSNGIDFYIMKNDDFTRVSWAVGNNECSILCALEPKEIYRMIDSIF